MRPEKKKKFTAKILNKPVHTRDAEPDERPGDDGPGPCPGMVD